MIKELINIADAFFNECIIIATVDGITGALEWVKTRYLQVKGIDTYNTLIDMLASSYAYNEKEASMFKSELNMEEVMRKVSSTGKHMSTYRAVIDEKFTWVNVFITKSADYSTYHPKYVLAFKEADRDTCTLQNSFRVIGTAMHKVLTVNLTTDLYDLHYEDAEGAANLTRDKKFSTWIKNFVSSGNVHQDDIKIFMSFANKDNLITWADSHKEGTYSVKYRRLSSNTWKWAKMYITRSHDYSYNNKTIVVYVRDIENDEVASLEKIKELSEESMLDSMTGCKNKRAFSDRIKPTNKTPSIIIYTDLNDLKHINDSKGHYYGDKYIIELSKAIKNVFNEDNCYRVGGDEFVVIYNCSNNESIEPLIDSFKKEIYKFNVSYGICTDSFIGTEGMLIKAESAMYSMKNKYHGN